jgi:SdpC family antimicrobial peptide
MKTPSNIRTLHLLSSLRKLASRWYVMLPLCGLLILVSCQHQENAQPTPQTNWSGQQLFKGLFLMDGPVADRIATYATLQQKYRFDQQPGLKSELARLGEQFIKAIDRGHPGFFADFQRSIRSGDHLQVEAAMTQGSEMLQYAIQQDPQLSPYYAQGLEMASKIDLAEVTDAQGRLDEAKLDAMADQYRNASPDSKEAKSMKMAACSLIAVCVVWILVAVAHQAAVAVHYATAINVAVWLSIWVKTYAPVSPNGATHTDLQREMVIQEITEELVLNAQ